MAKDIPEDNEQEDEEDIEEAEEAEAEDEDEESPFREQALDTISSPEQLDRVMVVVSPKGWIALWALVGLIIVGLIWAFVGRIPIEVDGKGIILTQKGLFSLSSPVNGIVSEIPVKIGDWVTPETIIAKVLDQSIIDQLKDQEFKIQKLNDSLKDASDKKDDIQKEIDKEKEALSNLKTKNVPFNIFATSIGRIIEIDTAVGNYIQPGELIAWAQYPLEPGEVPICHAYFNVKSGEQVSVGLPAKISLENVETNTYGYLEGKVIFVTEFPVSDRDLIQIMRNPQLVTFVKQGAPTVIAVHVQPIVDKNTFSGYAWTSEKGPPEYVKAGTICDVKVIVQNKRPISYLFPMWFEEKQPEVGPNPNIYPGAKR